MGITSRFLLIFCFFFFPLASEETVQVEKEEVEYPTPEASPPTLTSDIYQKNFRNTMIFVIVVIALVLLASYFLKNFLQTRHFLTGNQRKHIKILERRPLSPSTQLYIIEVGDQQIILTESKLEIKTLGTYMSSISSDD